MTDWMKSVFRALVVLFFVAPVWSLGTAVPGAEAETLITAELRPQKEAHPRLLLSDDRVDEIRSQMRTDPLMEDLVSEVTRRADHYMTLEPLAFTTDDRELMGQARAAVSRLLCWSLLYRLNGDERYLCAGRDLLLNVSAFPSWFNDQFLRAGEMSFAVSIGYDWLYSDLSQTEREIVRQALVDKVLSHVPAAYSPTGSSRRDAGWYAFKDYDLAFNNHNQVCNGGYLYAAAALWKDEPVLARQVVDGAVRSLPNALKYYGPDGGWAEGPVYWSYSLVYSVLSLAVLEDVFGTSFGLVEIPGMDRTADYAVQVFGPTGICFNYADCSRGTATGIGTGGHLTWLARRFEQPALLDLNRRRLSEFLQQVKPSGNLSKAEDRMLPLAVVWFPEEEEGAEAVPALDSHFRGDADIAMFRNRANDPDALWIGLKAGRNGVPHGNLDLGSFVLESDGVRWAVDLGMGNYALPGYWTSGNGAQRWEYYRCGSRSHNILDVGGGLQDAEAFAPIVEFDSGEKNAFAVVDLTDVYPGVASRIQRGVAMLDRTCVLIQDEVANLRAGQDVLWRMLTGATVDVASDGRSAVLKKNGEFLNLTILSPKSGAIFKSSLPPPLGPKEKRLGSIRVLEIELNPPCADLCLQVLITPGKHVVSGRSEVKVIPLSEWMIKKLP